MQSCRIESSTPLRPRRSSSTPLSQAAPKMHPTEYKCTIEMAGDKLPAFDYPDPPLGHTFTSNYPASHRASFWRPCTPGLYTYQEKWSGLNRTISSSNASGSLGGPAAAHTLISDLGRSGNPKRMKEIHSRNQAHRQASKPLTRRHAEQAPAAMCAWIPSTTDATLAQPRADTRSTITV